MENDTNPPPVIDSISQGLEEKIEQNPTTALPVNPLKKVTAFSQSWLLLGIIALFYVLPGLLLLSVFPRIDGGFATLKSFGMMGYAAACLGWFVFGILGVTRINTIKDRPRVRVTAMLKLVAIVLPAMTFGILVPILINVEPRLELEILSPTSQAELVAPVSVTFGMETALNYLKTTGVTPIKYEWDFTGDGVIDQETFEPEATYTFGKSNIFRVLAVVTMTNGERKTLIKSFLVPSASFGSMPADPVIEESVTLSLEHLFPEQVNPQIPTLAKAKWDFDGDGAIDLETEKKTATNVYHRLGPVQVSVLMELTNKTQTTYKRTLNVVKALEQPFPITLDTEPVTLLGPPPFGVLFILKTKEPIANASWDFGNGKKGEGLRTAQVYSSVGDYSVQVTARSQSGAIAKLTKTIRVTNPLQIPDLSFDGSPSVQNFTIEGQVPLTIDLTPVTSLPLVSFSWDIAKTNESSIADRTLHAVYRDPGTYFADLLGVDPDQNVFRRRIKIIAKQAESFVNFTMDPETPTAPATVIFDGSDTFVPNDEITGFEWDFGDASQDDTSKFSGARREHTFIKPGTYSITLQVRTTSGKSFENRKTIVVRAPILSACFLPSRNSGKAPLGVRFDASCSTGEFLSWVWDFGDGSKSDQASPVHVFEKAGNFTVTLTGKTADGRTSSKTSLLTISSP